MKRKRVSELEDKGQTENSAHRPKSTKTDHGSNGFKLEATNESKEITDLATDSLSRRPSQGESDGMICDRCAAIDFKKLFIVDCSRENEPLVDLGYLGKKYEQSSCEICRLFHYVKIDCVDHTGKTSYAIFCTPVGLIGRRALRVSCIKCGTQAEPLQMLIGLSKIDQVFWGIWSKPLMISQLEPNYIDFKRILLWIVLCEELHQKSESCVDRVKTAEYPQNMKLIDCKKRTIVKAQPEFIYCALSYVWGGSNHVHSQTVHESEQLPTSLPQTIEDAITVTKKLGSRYLWVDRYCIDQSSKSEKHNQISQMNLIYRNSYVTIIAAAGDNASHGLPGVSTTPRDLQLTAKSGDLHLRSFFSSPHKVLPASSWIKRGWTFQEGFFSSRRLVFTSKHVYYECREASIYEFGSHSPSLWNSKTFFRDVVQRRKDYRDIGVRYQYGSPGFFHDIIQKRKRPWEISTLLAEYSTRELSFSTDAINAFEGVIRDFESGSDAITHHWGVLIMPPVIAGRRSGVQKCNNRKKSHRLLAGLCWRNVGQGPRRMDFPSWSWAGWACAISDFHPELGAGLGFEQFSEPGHYPTLLIEELDGQLRDFEDIAEPDQSNEPASQILRLNAWAIPLRLRRSCKPEDGLNVLRGHVRHSHYVMFEDEDYMLVAPVQTLYPNRYTYYFVNQIWEKKYVTSEIYGVLMGQGDLSTSSRPKKYRFFLVIMKLGPSFRRIGHMEVHEEFKVTKKPTCTEQRQVDCWGDIEPQQARRILLGQGKRMDIRLE